LARRDRYLLGVVGLLALVGVFWFLAMSPKLKDLDKASKDVDAAETAYETARQEAQQYALARLQFPGAYSSMAKLGKAVPAKTDQASLLYQLDVAADRAGVKFVALELTGSDSAGAGDEGASAPPAPAAPPAGESAGNQPAGSAPPAGGQAAGTTGGAGATGAPAPAGTETAEGSEDDTFGSVPADATLTAAAPAGSAAGSAELRVMHYSLNFEGSFFRLEDLIRNLKRLSWSSRRDLHISGRLLTIDAIDLSEDKVGIAATVFLMPSSQGLFAGATPAGPAGIGAATPQTTAAPGAAPVPPTAAVTP
jgi:hypothetical protein